MKLLRTPPRWNAFRGFSLLFDNPGFDPAVDGDHVYTRGRIAPDDDVYAALLDWRDSIDVGRWQDRYGLHLTPPHSLHVTAWDGLNARNLHALKTPALRNEVQAALDALPDTSQIAMLATQSLGTAWARVDQCLPIRLTVSRIARDASVGFFAEFVPADSASDAALRQWLDARANISTVAQAHWGAQPSLRRPLVLHATLGYFLHGHTLDLFDTEVVASARSCVDALQSTPLVLESMSIYSFIDMATFLHTGRLPAPRPECA